MIDTYWLVTYFSESKEDSSKITTNAILKNIHPVIWAASPPPIYALYNVTKLLWFTEIPKEVALNEKVSRWCGIEELEKHDA